MPLNLEATTEHPDVTALKIKVKEVAGRYAKQNNWCGTVRQALIEAGINDPDQVEVAIAFTVSGSPTQTATKKFLVNDLAGKTEADQNSWVADQIAPKVNVAGTEVTLPVTVTDLMQVGDIITPGVKGANRDVNGMDVPDGYIALYTSVEGRVAHLIAAPSSVRDGVLTERDYLAQNNLRHVRFLCGKDAGYQYPVLNSDRSENRICQDCTSRVNKR